VEILRRRRARLARRSADEPHPLRHRPPQALPHPAGTHPQPDRAVHPRPYLRRRQSRGPARAVVAAARPLRRRIQFVRSIVNGTFIGGRPVASTGPVLKLVDPATGETSGEVATTAPAQVADAVRSAQDAAPAWAALTPGQRARRLLALADAIDADAVTLTEREVAESGKPWTAMIDGELPFATVNLRFFAGAARSLDGTGAGVFSEGYTSMMVRRPLGVVGGIAPWNFPLIMALW